MLEPPECHVVQIIRPMALKSRQFDEDSPHKPIIRNLRIYASYVANAGRGAGREAALENLKAVGRTPTTHMFKGRA
jgi:hypothetical protein